MKTNFTTIIFSILILASTGVPLYGQIQWTKYPDPALGPGDEGSWDDDALLAPCVVLVNDTLHMWYAGFKLGSSHEQIGHAISTDWNTWQKDAVNPVLTTGNSQDWDWGGISGSKVIHDGTVNHMFYAGGIYPNFEIGYAYANDGTQWTKYDDPNTTGDPYMHSDPVINRGPAGSWDDGGIYTGSVLFHSSGDSLHIWYTGTNESASTFSIAYAAAAIDFTSLAEKMEILSDNFMLFDNYPNPFNPSTTIEFKIPNSQFVTLKIYNLLGQDVATLVSEKLNPENHTVQFDGSKFTTGVYYYQLKADDYQQVKKMVLLR